MPSKNLDQNNLQLIRHNTSLVKKLYPNINRARIQALKELTKQFSFSFASGDVIQLENGWFVTHTGLVRLARRKRCRGIHVEAVDSLCDSAANRFVLKATVYPSKDSAGFVGYGDADPSNVSLMVRGDADAICLAQGAIDGSSFRYAHLGARSICRSKASSRKATIKPRALHS